MSNDKKRIVYGAVDEDTHTSLAIIATANGEKIFNIINDAIVDYIQKETDKMGQGAPIDLKIYRSVQQARLVDRRRNQLVQIAWAHSNNPTEESADLLNELCNEADFPVEDIIAEIESSPMIPLGSDDGTGKFSAMRWLINFLPPGRPIKTKVIHAKGKEYNFSAGTLNAAKRELGIISKKPADYWVWIREAPIEIETTKVETEK